MKERKKGNNEYYYYYIIGKGERESKVCACVKYKRGKKVQGSWDMLKQR